MRQIKDNSNYRDTYDLKYDWPDDCFIQGGSSGVVVSSKGNYETHYIEAFPTNPSCFLRGEGKSFDEAEKKVYEQFIKIINCKKHNFIKMKNYKNGMGKCENCGLTKVVFESDYTCIKCGKHENYSYIKKEFRKTENDCLCEDCSNKRENLLYLNTDTIRFKIRNISKILMGKSILKESTFNELKSYLNINKDGLNISEDIFFEILNKDDNMFLVEYMNRIKNFDDITITFFRKYFNLNEEKDEYEINIIDYFYDNFMKRNIDNGYK